jgi:chaperonin GroEL
LGDDLDRIQPDCLGEVVKSVTDNRTTVLTTGVLNKDVSNRVKEIEKKIPEIKDPFFKKKQQERLAMLNGSVGIIRVGADSKIELKEKKDRVEDAIYAVKAALQEGIVPGGGIALLNAALSIKEENEGEKMLTRAIASPFMTILENAGIEITKTPTKVGYGIDVITGKEVNMVKNGIIDPVLVTKTALKNAVSVVSTIVSADCVISNIRIDNASS